jgi:hypothetical protein
MIPEICGGRGVPTEEKRVPKWECACPGNLAIPTQAFDELLASQFDIPDTDVRSQFVSSVAVILERLSEPAAG